MPNKNHIINLPGFILIKTTGFSPITYHVEYRKQPKQCIYCKANKLRIKDKILRKVRHESVGERCTFLSFFINKYHCVNCNKYFHQPIAGIQPYQRASEKLKAQIFTQHTHGISNKDLASSFKIGKATVERYYRQHYDRYHQQIKHRHCPSVLGIDEHFFSKKQGYATTLCDLRKHKVFDIVKGKTKQTLASYFEQLTGKDKVRVVCMDLSSSYKSIVKQFFPQAKIVADRFHVIRLLHYRCMKTYQQISANIKHNRPIMSLLRTNPNHLSAKQMTRLNELLEQYPAKNASIVNEKAPLKKTMR